MARALALVLLSFLGLAAPPGQSVVDLTPGLVIDRSVRVRPGIYRLPSASLGAPALRVRGDDVTVDLTDVTIEGADPAADPDTLSGVGILVEDSSRVTVRGGAVRGFKVGLLGRRAPKLHVTGADFSYNWKPRLWSGIEKESLADWLTYHHNDRDEWLRYGAAIYLAECDEAEVDGTRAVQGQNGLMVARSAHLTIRNNTFSWLSGVGLGLYRTTDSIIESNELDWDVRGYSHGFYNRGQDSAALLMYEQSSRNTVAHNSATYGGDGLFLWAGQSTMDSGQGGANDNVFLDNDFSHAVANGIEATFSRNRFEQNLLEDCWHGVWGGYSYDSVFTGNSFSGNSEGIAIEHGQNITIADNHFAGDETAIRLWANLSQDPSWGYAKARDTRSRDYVIERNEFSGNKTALNVLRTTDVRVEGNAYTALDSKRPDGAVRDRSAIIVDEWGPYDYRSPKLWPAGKPGDRPLKLRVLGPPGKWALKSIRGGTAGARAGDVPGELTVALTTPGRDLRVVLEYVGGEVVTPRGAVIKAGAPAAFSYTSFDPAIDWTVKYWSFDADSDPVAAPEAFATRLRGVPLKTGHVPHLDYLGSGALAPGLPRERIALRAEGDVRLPAGAFELTVISDDGVRVWIDNRLVVDRWSVHESAVDHATVAGGRHRVRVEYFQVTGWAELQLRFERK